MKSIYNSFFQVLSTAEVCAETGMTLPALILAYSAMDTLGWLAAENPKSRVQDRFIAWVERYALPEIPRLRCTARELYAARCAVLHTFTSESDLSDRGVRKIVYAWGTADAEILRQMTEKVGPSAWVEAHVSDITAAARLGAARFFEAAESDLSLKRRIAERGDGFFQMIGLNELLGNPPTNN